MTKRADKKRNIDKVAAELVKNPLQTQREIAKNADLGLGTVNRATKEVEQQQWYKELIRSFEEERKNSIEIDGKTLDIDEDIASDFVNYIGSYKKAVKEIEYFMLKSMQGYNRKRRSINQNTRYSILERAGFKCQACGAKPSKDNDVELHIDHIIPVARGGLNIESNYQVLCKICNTSKGGNHFYNHND